MKSIILICLLSLGLFSQAQDKRGVYQKRSCFCENHSNENGFYFGIGGYASQLSFQNNRISSNSMVIGGGGLLGNKFTEHLAIQAGAFYGISKDLVLVDRGVTSTYSGYNFKYLNVPVSLLYRFNTEQRISPYLIAGIEVNSLVGVTGVENTDQAQSIEMDESGFNQLNVEIGGGTYVLSGDHLGFFFQGSIQYTPMESSYYTIYQYAFTGKVGLTYHL